MGYLRPSPFYQLSRQYRTLGLSSRPYGTGGLQKVVLGFPGHSEIVFPEGVGRIPAFPSHARLFQVILPVLANEKNHQGWPHAVCQDVQRHAHGLQGDLLVILEKVRGKTLLPLPAGTENVGSVDSESDTV